MDNFVQNIRLTKIQNRSGDTTARYGNPSGVAMTMTKAIKTSRKLLTMYIDCLNRVRVGTIRPPIINENPARKMAINKSGLADGSERACIGTNMSNEKMM